MVLSDLKPGETAIIQDTSLLDDTLHKRLIQFGIREGTVIGVKGILPFKGPFVIELKGQKIGIRMNAATKIKVERK